MGDDGAVKIFDLAETDIATTTTARNLNSVIARSPADTGRRSNLLGLSRRSVSRGIASSPAVVGGLLAMTLRNRGEFFAEIIEDHFTAAGEALAVFGHFGKLVEHDAGLGGVAFDHRETLEFVDVGGAVK